MRARVGLLVGLSVFLLLAGASCVDESPTAPSQAPVYMPLVPGGQATYQFMGDNGELVFWETRVRPTPEGTTIVDEDTLWTVADAVYGVDYYSTEGVLTLTRFMVQRGPISYVAAEKTIGGETTLWTVFPDPLRFSPSGMGPAETWTHETTWTFYEVGPEDTNRETGTYVLIGRVLGVERIVVPAPQVDDPADALWVEYYGQGDSDPDPETHVQFWLVDGVGIVRQVDLLFGDTVSELSDLP